jgi:hypothetical protein
MNFSHHSQRLRAFPRAGNSIPTLLKPAGACFYCLNQHMTMQLSLSGF